MLALPGESFVQSLLLLHRLIVVVVLRFQVRAIFARACTPQQRQKMLFSRLVKLVEAEGRALAPGWGACSIVQPNGSLTTALVAPNGRKLSSLNKALG